MLCSFPSTGLLPPWLGLFLGTLFFLLLYQMGFYSWFLFLQFRCWCTGVPLISEYNLSFIDVKILFYITFHLYLVSIWISACVHKMLRVETFSLSLLKCFRSSQLQKLNEHPWGLCVYLPVLFFENFRSSLE